jgi:hypothetical protein
VIDPLCPIHGGPMRRVDIQTCTCLKITFTTRYGTATSTTDWSKAMKAIRDWSATLHGQVDGTRTPVPDAFQDAFKDGELEV